MRNAASHREWLTETGQAQFLLAEPIHWNPLDAARSDDLILATIRSHDQYNTTIYGKNDRYRGITGRRDVIFMNADDVREKGLTHGALVDVQATGAGLGGAARILRNQTVVEFDIARGSVAAYYPEANLLVALDHYDRQCGTPSYKSVAVRIVKAGSL